MPVQKKQTPKKQTQKKQRSRKSAKSSFMSITKFLFVTTQIFVFIWISISYLIAIYATVKLEQPFPVVELSGQAMGVILGNVGMKTVSNLFEHNNGGLFGTSNTTADTSTPTI